MITPKSWIFICPSNLSLWREKVGEEIDAADKHALSQCTISLSYTVELPKGDRLLAVKLIFQTVPSRSIVPGPSTVCPETV